MPLVSQLGEQSINSAIGVDNPGRGVWLLKDSDGNLFGLVEEYRAGEMRLSAFFILGDSGMVTSRYAIGWDTAFNIAQYDQDAFLIYPADNGFQAFQPTIVSSQSEPRQFEGDIMDYPPEYLFDRGTLVFAGTEPPVPAGSATVSSFANGTARVYLAPDGDGTGIFLDVRDFEGNRIGGVVRVNENTEGEQVGAIVGGLDEAFTVAWTQEAYNGANTELYLSKTFDLSPNVGLAVIRDELAQEFVGDAGDFVTDIFFFDNASAEGLDRDSIVNFGRNDILVTTTKIFDSNEDGIITLGRDKRLDLANATGDAVASIEFAGGVRSLEFDGAVEGIDGRTYYVYTRLGSEADEHYLIV